MRLRPRAMVGCICKPVLCRRVQSIMYIARAPRRTRGIRRQKPTWVGQRPAGYIAALLVPASACNPRNGRRRWWPAERRADIPCDPEAAQYIDVNRLITQRSSQLTDSL